MDGSLVRQLICCGIALAFSFVSSATGATGIDPAVARSMLDDAELRDVRFIDAMQGWAVGDRGVIWNTTDGGTTWRLQLSDSDAELVSVCFLDESNGWAAGGRHRPYLRSTAGVLLRTHDGGQSWEADKGLMLPAIKSVKFFSPQQGWAVADSSDLFPSSVFHTDSGGRAWAPLTAREVTEWTVADFANPQIAAIAGSRGARGAIRERVLRRFEQPELGLREPRALRLGSTSAGWLVGDCGLVQTTTDGGRSWLSAPQEPSGAAHFDFRAVEVRGRDVWIAGVPGSRVFHSPDGGTTWESSATGQNLPLNALTFVDRQHGWAVGALGTILVTSDGGHSWQRQRGPRQRAALLAVYSDADRAPLEAVARMAANDGFVTAVEWIARRDAEADTPSAAGASERERAAVVALGGSAADRAWGFPLRQPGIHPAVEQIVAGWDRMYSGRGVERLQEHLVRTIRTWKPDVVLTSAASPAGEDPLGHLVNQVVLRAVADAADTQKFPEQAAVTGLSTWSVKKVAGSLPAGKLGTINVNTSQLAPRLARSLADYSGAARGLLSDGYHAPPTAWGFRLYLDQIPQGLGQQDFFSGITLEPGGDARREVPAAPRAGLDAMRQIAEKHRNLQAIVASAERTGRGGAVLLGQIGDLTRGLDGETAGQALFELGHTYYSSGQWDFAAATFELLTEQHPNHSLAAPALAWLVQYWASGEAATRALARSGPQHDLATARNGKSQGIVPAAALLPADQLNSASPIGTRRDATSEPTGLSARRARATALGQVLERLDGQSWSEMHVQFPLAVARQTEGGREPDRFFSTIVSARPQDAWWECARSEMWLRGSMRDAPPKTTAILHAATLKPRLDGQLDDEVWQDAERLELKSAQADDAEWPTTTMLAYDDKFLYLAVACRFALDAKYPDETRTRGRDADLSSFDRVDVLLDIDRDFTTFYRLAVDYRGWTAEDCWGDASWNPRWFVAAARDADGWAVEAAIPLAELSSDPIAAKTAWALGLQRTVPGVGFQSWTRPATVAVAPQGFGVLQFD